MRDAVTTQSRRFFPLEQLRRDGSPRLLAARMRERRRRQGQREGGLVPRTLRELQSAWPHFTRHFQVFNENGGIPLPQQRKRLPIYGNRSEFLCADALNPQHKTTPQPFRRSALAQ